jgi:hypothetical protein
LKSLIPRLILTTLLFVPSLAVAANQPNPADFPISIHVVSSRSRTEYAAGMSVALQYLETIIDNQPVELACTSTGVLALGSYPARISTKVRLPKHPNTYDIYRAYDLLMPDQNIRTCSVLGLGPIPAANP